MPALLDGGAPLDADTLAFTKIKGNGMMTCLWMALARLFLMSFKKCALDAGGWSMQGGGLETDCLFVYGTLMPASSHPMAHRLASESAFLGPATICGRLYDLGDYPAAVPSTDPAKRVHGALLRLDDRASLRWLDAYEGCGEDDAEPHAYQRVIASAFLEYGQAIDAWIYYYRWPLGKARWLRDGRYAASKPLLSLDF